MASLSALTLPATLNPPLTGRDAVTDAVYRVILAFDTNNVDLLKSSIAEDAILVLNGNTMHGLQTIIHGIFAKVSELDTTHSLTNIRVNIDGAKATLTGTVLAQHYRGGTGSDPKAERYLAGAFYMVDLVKEEGGHAELWKVTKWQVQRAWCEGDASIVQ